MHQAWKRKDKLITISNITHSNKLVFSGFRDRKKAEVYINYNYQNQGPLVNHPH